MTQKSSRLIDHLVLPVSDMDVARKRYNDLGFTVAANGVHPFGTVNACVFLADKTYLEPLAVADDAVAKEAIAAGNVFIARDHLFRQQQGEGLSAVVVQSEDAQEDHAAFVKAGYSGGDMLEFSRPVMLPNGQESISRFRLAFAVDALENLFFLFSCERLNPLPSDRAALEAHANGVKGLKRIFLQADLKEGHKALMKAVLGTHGHAITNGYAFDTRNLSVEVGGSAAVNGGLVALALVFAVADLEVTAAVLTANGVDHVTTPDGISVPAAPGQGVAFLFEENAP
ncbi:catechol 2,3-dioxygenase-like lactoylglutathione lyase family enzyme [Agrobacterium vitis]|nr:catechol 2,3-dioxygenase-like lactoylglutathione lyase family enzyme [Agrobacterium vitis]MBE1438821.1 catechol 2,3-dioxygenase-like lactoylglutathione lyase family enzyme [Agrobacterium vitis]